MYHIEVNGHGSNFGRTGKVRSVGKQRLTIDFDDNNPKGLYVSWWDAMLIDGPSVPRPTTTEFIDRTPGSRAAEPTIIERVVHVSDNVTTLPHVERTNGGQSTRSRTERRLNFDGQNENRPRDMESILQEYIRAVRNNNTTNIANSKDRSDQRHRQA